MVITIILVSAVALVAATLATIIRQKALAYQAYRCDEDALGKLPLRPAARARQVALRQSTRLRTAALARRKASHACGHHAYS
ncbi:hypothetical protein N7E02_16050 [Aliirhizobium terrae]|uniref:hypothetical protein n=1 Tax=Terrirhizobium terrae TaxID=2926709 RepID=UPI002576E1F9|nr:hypothetical protein [Rhizobium sp. CC-CFT758]WJH41777.1 hypothetical protein N7E02_16050 [Rhizobium sp. CC-CFT758]